jgi:glucose-6-phosphate 1-epimerase
MNIDDLNEKFAIEGEVGFAELDGDLPFIMIANKFADVNICLYGAHITGFKPTRSEETLWMSSKSSFEEGEAIRGGIPVCFPWFGVHETENEFPQHGFARIMMWDVKNVETLSAGETEIVLQLCSSDETKKYWPFDFCAEMIFIVGTKLEVSLKITNTSDEPIKYTAALHSYFSVSAIENISIEGLEDTHYQDQLDGGDYIQEEKLLTIGNAETRHYYNTTNDCAIHDPYFNRRITIEKRGSTNTTVWNPWVDTCAQMKDMPDDGYETFVCLETVNKINGVIQLAPGEVHETTAIIGVE